MNKENINYFLGRIDEKNPPKQPGKSTEIMWVGKGLRDGYIRKETAEAIMKLLTEDNE